MHQREMTRKKWLNSDSAPFVVLLALLALPRGSGRLLFNPYVSWRKVRKSFIFLGLGVYLYMLLRSYRLCIFSYAALLDGVDIIFKGGYGSALCHIAKKKFLFETCKSQKLDSKGNVTE